MAKRQGNDVAKFRTRLKDHMDEKGIERMDLVRGVEVSYPTVMKWETEGMQSLDADLVERFSKFLGVGWQELIYIVEDE